MKPIKNIELLPQGLKTPKAGEDPILFRPDLDRYQTMSPSVNHQRVHEKEKGESEILMESLESDFVKDVPELISLMADAPLSAT